MTHSTVVDGIGCAQLDELLAAPCSSSDDDAADAGDQSVELMEGECEHDEGDDVPTPLPRIGCRADFDVLAPQPLDEAARIGMTCSTPSARLERASGYSAPTRSAVITKLSTRA